MRLIIMTCITLLVAAVSGFGSAWLALGEHPPIGGVQIGQWRTWPGLGGPAIDPYARAINSRTGALPLGAGEGIELIAERDSDNRPLTGRCAYQITGQTPEARIWTLAATRIAPLSARHDARRQSRAGTHAAAPPASSILTSDGLLRQADGAIHITASATAAPGDWLLTPDDAPFRLTLRLYDSPTGLTSRPHVAGQVMPTIKRSACR